MDCKVTVYFVDIKKKEKKILNFLVLMLIAIHKTKFKNKHACLLYWCFHFKIYFQEVYHQHFGIGFKNEGTLESTVFMLHSTR